MKNFQNIFMLAIGVIIGICCSNVFSCNTPIVQPKSIIKNNTAKDIQTQVQQATQHYQQSMDSLQIHNTALAKQLTDNKKTLASLKQKNIILQTQLYDLIDAKKYIADTTENMNCTAIESKAIELMQNNTARDSVCDATINTLETQVQNRDSCLLAKDTLLQHLQTAIDKSLVQQGFLEEQNKLYLKQYKRQKHKNTFLSVGILVVAGLFANHLLQH